MLCNKDEIDKTPCLDTLKWKTLLTPAANAAAAASVAVMVMVMVIVMVMMLVIMMMTMAVTVQRPMSDHQHHLHNIIISNVLGSSPSTEATHDVYSLLW
jgi:heme/copper-type cytochrome/quinol oxidase subunit 2